MSALASENSNSSAQSTEIPAAQWQAWRELWRRLLLPRDEGETPKGDTEPTTNLNPSDINSKSQTPNDK